MPCAPYWYPRGHKAGKICPSYRAVLMQTFQDLILALQDFWAQKGCVLLQPYDMEVGAGTFHTATFLRAIGPEPWNAAYVQPSRRPKDGRYGDNPNRLQHYYQYQVALKPSPPASPAAAGAVKAAWPRTAQFPRIIR